MQQLYAFQLYLVKLLKLLWYIDALSYKRRGFAMTGLVYQALLTDVISDIIDATVIRS